jgi:hypothetical protein
VAVYASSGGSVNISDCDFTGTNAGSSGGAVDAYASSGSVSISNCNFKDTEAGDNGGAVDAYASGGSVNISDCDFTGTNAGRYGGAIAVADGYNNSSCVLKDVSFTGCIATSNGNVLYGNVWGGDGSYSMVFTVKPGCSVDGTTITSSNLNSVLPQPSMVLLTNVASIKFEP